MIGWEKKPSAIPGSGGRNYELGGVICSLIYGGGGGREQGNPPKKKINGKDGNSPGCRTTNRILCPAYC